MGLHELVGEVHCVHYGHDHHDEMEGEEVVSVSQLQAVDWLSQFHHVSRQSHR